MTLDTLAQVVLTPLVVAFVWRLGTLMGRLARIRMPPRSVLLTIPPPVQHGPGRPPHGEPHATRGSCAPVSDGPWVPAHGPCDDSDHSPDDGGPIEASLGR